MKTSNTLRVKLLLSKGKLPTKGMNLAAGYNLSSAQQLTIPINGRALVQTDISISVPKGMYGRIAPRSGLAVKHGITTGAGVIDTDYTRPLGIVLFNHGDQDYKYKEIESLSSYSNKSQTNQSWKSRNSLRPNEETRGSAQPGANR